MSTTSKTAINDKKITDINQLFEFTPDYIKFFINSAILKGFMLNKRIDYVIREELEKKINSKHPKFLTVYNKILNTYKDNDKVFWQVQTYNYKQTKSQYDKKYNKEFGYESEMPFSIFMGIVNSIVKYTHKSSYDIIKQIASDMNLDFSSLIKAQRKPHTYIIERDYIDNEIDIWNGTYDEVIKRKRMLYTKAHPVLSFLDNPLGYFKDKSLLKTSDLLKPNITFKLIDIEDRQID